MNIFENTKDVEKVVDDFVGKVKANGTDVDNEKVQLDIFKNFLDNDFDLEKVNPETITEYDSTLEESAGAGGLDVALNAIESSEIIQQQIIDRLGIDKAKVKKAIDWIRKMLMLVPNLIEKGFYKLARLFGVNIEDSKTAGKVGLGLFAIFCTVMAIIHLPALIGGLGAAFGILSILKLLAGIAKLGSGIYNMWKKYKAVDKEQSDEVYTTNDFLTEIEPVWKRLRTTRGENISHDVVDDLYNLSNSIKDNKKEFAITLKNLARIIKEDGVTEMGEVGRDTLKTKVKYFQELIKMAENLGDSKAKESIITLKAHFTAPPNPKYAQKKVQMEVRKLVRDIISESFSQN